MAMSKISTNNPNLHGPWNVASGIDAWWVQGELYTDNPGILAYVAKDPGTYTVTVAQPTQAYLAAAAAMRADPNWKPATGQMPGTRNYPITP